MHKAIAHHPLTDAQPVPKHRLLSPDQLPLVYMFSMTSHGTEHPFGQLGSAVLAVSPPRLLCTPSLLLGRAVWEAEKPLTESKHYLATTKPSVCYQHYSHPKSKTQHCISY